MTVEEEPEPWFKRLFKPEEEVRSAVAGNNASSDDLFLVKNILKLRSITVSDIAVPRVDIVSAPLNTSLKDLAILMAKADHSRLLIHGENLDDVKGTVHARDLVPHAYDEKEPVLETLLVDPLFTVESMPVVELLNEMRHTGIHMAVMVDEFGGVDGLVTIEDIIEQVIGEIEKNTPLLTKKGEGVFEVDARMRLDDLEEKLGPLVQGDIRETVTTVGGLVFVTAGKVPEKGAKIPYNGTMVIEVMESDNRKIHKLKVTFNKEPVET